jgi:hypothetical protein
MLEDQYDRTPKPIIGSYWYYTIENRKRIDWIKGIEDDYWYHPETSQGRSIRQTMIENDKSLWFYRKTLGIVLVLIALMGFGIGWICFGFFLAGLVACMFAPLFAIMGLNCIGLILYFSYGERWFKNHPEIYAFTYIPIQL